MAKITSSLRHDRQVAAGKRQQGVGAAGEPLRPVDVREKLGSGWVGKVVKVNPRSRRAV